MKWFSRPLYPIFAGILGFSVGFTASVPASLARSLTESLNRQLSIPLNNGTLSPQRQDADRLMQEGDRQLQAGYVDSALTLWQEALVSYIELGDSPAEEQVYRRLTDAYLRQGNLRSAEEMARKQLGTARVMNDYSALVYGYNQVGSILLQSSTAQEAEKSFVEGYRIAESVQNRGGMGLSLSNWGLAAYRQGRFEEAIARLQDSLPLRRDVLDLAGEANTQNHLGDAYFATGNYSRSAAAYLNGLFLGEMSQKPALMARSLGGLSVSYERLGARRDYMDTLVRQLRVAARSNEPTQVVTALQAFAQHSEKEKNLAAADSYYQQAIAVAQTSGDAKTAKRLQRVLDNLRAAYYFSPKVQ
ncbi:MAG: tetratricopeptide repeat protein [Synechococcales bacterium]|nr:tetratricopeptide repeat protein [Synechococcales bacterium]